MGFVGPLEVEEEQPEQIRAARQRASVVFVEVPNHALK
jgi:hypothetical protein